LYRQGLFPGSAAAEAGMERHEGLPEYTGVVVALRATGETVDREARVVEAFEDSDAYARSFAYATGPALGLLLDRYAEGWRGRAASAGLGSMLVAALKVRVPQDLAGEARKQAARYGYAAVSAAEKEREERHQAVLADLTSRFLNGPTLDFPATPDSNRTFNPMALVPFPPHGTYYPTGTFTAKWGKLEVKSAGALVAPDNATLRVPAPADPNARPLAGEGWVLQLAAGWTIVRSERAGSYRVSPEK
jgi:hypothetical protein